jgi:phosphotransferase system enzyme I (PtsP)
MVEVPSLYWQLNSLLERVDFVSIGSNDLFQFLFACDRGNPALADRYDVLSPPALSFFRDMVQRCRAAGVRLSVCGEMASRPLEAMALIGLGVHHLSLVPSEVGPVKAMLRSIDAAPLERYLRRLLDLPDHSLRGRLQAYAQDHGVVLPTSAYQPI